MNRVIGCVLLGAVLVGCPGADKLDDTGPETRREDAPDIDTGPAPTDDSGRAAIVYWLAEFETAAGGFTSARLGFGAAGYSEFICTLQGALEYEGAAPDGCPDCDWSFDLGPISGGTLAGSRCDHLYGDTLFAEATSLDGHFDWSWGFAPAHTYYASDGTAYALEETLFTYSEAGWELFAFNYGDRVPMIEGDATSLTVEAPAVREGAYIYYYYYP